MSEKTNSKSLTSVESAKARVVIQQCLHATLKHPSQTTEGDAESIDGLTREINKGMVIYICFLQGASEDILEKIVKFVLDVKLSEDDEGKQASVLDIAGDILIIPQATLGGKPKGTVIQYHSNINKEVGSELYIKFVENIIQAVSVNPKYTENAAVVQWGTFGQRQILSLETNGPYTHQFEFS